ncbi:hypothetical protein BASA81_000119 [Batrachochytrium salamandrivorans]|nr:hypothetical protein BASA81_000119 [Batrachochytrium salamandrivorans]
MFRFTREYHDARREWMDQLPGPPTTDLEGDITMGKLNFLEDLDKVSIGKLGIMFSLSNVYYQSYEIGDALIGHVKLLVPHYGSLVTAFDDLQGMISGGYCLTKTLDMELFPEFTLDQQDYTFRCMIDKKETSERYEATTRLELFSGEEGGTLVARSNAVFVRTQAVLQGIRVKMEAHNEKGAWERIAPLRISGEHANDPTMSFMVNLPRPNTCPIPSWWGNALSMRQAQPHVFEGRIELYNVNLHENGVRAVVLPLLSSEGAPGLFHGGAAGAICIEVLRNLLPGLWLKDFQVRFRRPIQLLVEFVVEWTRSPQQQPGEWIGQLLDLQRNVLQEVVVHEHHPFGAFTNTREFHTARKAWVKALPSFPSHAESELDPSAPSMFVNDMDQVFNGKAGVAFPFGTCMYHFRTVTQSPETMVAFTRLSVANFGSLFVVLDDLQAIASGGHCLTKTIQVQVLPGFEFSPAVDYSIVVITQTNVLPGNKGMDLITKLECRNPRGELVAVSNAVFFTSDSILAVLNNQVNQDMGVLWKRLEMLRLAGEHPNDPTMSFLLTMPRPVLQDVPTWWDAGVARHEPKHSAAQFPGRIEVYNVEFIGQRGVRAVVLPRLTSEGAPSLVHGGATASACVEVLANLVPNLQVAKMEVKFKRRIAVETKLVVEITNAGIGQWAAQILDWDRVVLQELVIYEQAKVKL